MPRKEIKFGKAKSIIYTIIIVLLFFALVETAQRIRYSLRFRSGYWLLYGMVKLPSDYEAMHERGLERERLGVDVIEVRNINYDGYRKYNPDWKNTEHRINSFGFRGEEFDAAKSEGSVRIVALGGSTTFGVGVEDGSTYPEFLEEILNSGLDGKYEVINAGISAAMATEVSNLLDKEVLSFNPDMIIVNSLFNNLYNSKITYKIRWNIIRMLNQILLAKSLLYCTLREKVAIVLNKSPGDLYKASLSDMFYNFMHDESFWRDLKSAFTDMARTAGSHDVRMIIINQPVWLRDYKRENARSLLFDEMLRPVYQRAYALFDELASEEGVEVVNAAASFERLQDKEELYTDGLHLTEKGNKYLATLVAERILDSAK